MEVVSGTIRSLTPEATVYDFCREATAAVSVFYHETPFVPDSSLMASSAVVYSIARHELWFVGDCQALVNGVLYEYAKPEEAVLANKRAAYLERLIADGLVSLEMCQTNDPGRDVIMKELRHSCTRQNMDYAVINGMPIPQHLIHTLDVPEASDVVLASDGYPFLCSSLEESEAKLAEVMEKDPLCIRMYKATKGLRKGNKSFDDRAYLRIKV